MYSLNVIFFAYLLFSSQRDNILPRLLSNNPITVRVEYFGDAQGNNDEDWYVYLDGVLQASLSNFDVDASLTMNPAKFLLAGQGCGPQIILKDLTTWKDCCMCCFYLMNLKITPFPRPMYA